MIVINFTNDAGESIKVDRCLQNGAGFIIYTSQKQSESFKKPVNNLFIQTILTTRSIAAMSMNSGIDMVNLVKEIYHAYRTEMIDASVDIFNASQSMLTAVLHLLKNDPVTANCARTAMLVGIRAVALNNSTGYLIDEFDNEIININSCVAGPGVLVIFKDGDCCYYNFYGNNSWHHFIEPLFNTKKRYNGVLDFIGKVYFFGKYVSPNYLETRFENVGVHVDEEIYNDILCREVN